MINRIDAFLANPAQLLWAVRRQWAIGAALGFALAVMICLFAPNRWDASVLVGPAGRGAASDYSALLPAADAPAIQYLLQRVSAVTAAEFSVYEALLTSQRVAGALQKDTALQKRLPTLCKDCSANAPRLARWLKRHVRITPVGGTQMRRITLRMADKILALDMLRALHRLSDEAIRTDRRVRATQRIAYLRTQLDATANLAQRDVLIELLKEQSRQKMMVGIDADFAAEVIDPPALPVRPSFPDPYILLPLFLLMGALSGAACGVLRK